MKRKLLVVDDDYALRELIDFTLAESYDVLKAENAEQAYALVHGEQPDAIVLDIMMPNIDGYEVCRKLKSDPKTQHIPIIMLTAKHEMDDLKEAIKVGADEYITKPFEPDFLKKRIDGLFEKTRREEKLFQHGKSLHYIRGN